MFKQKCSWLSKQPNVNQWMNKQTKRSKSKQGNTGHYYEDLINGTMRMNQITVLCCYMKKARYKGSPILWLHLYEISRLGKSTKTGDE